MVRSEPVPNGANYAVFNTSELEKAIEKVTDSERKLQLLRELDAKGLCTRDIFSFEKNQALLRVINKSLHKPTIKQAMKAKIDDSKKVLKADISKLNSVRKWLLDKLGGRRFKLRKLVKKIKKNTIDRTLSKIEKNKNKIKHCEKVQSIERTLKEKTRETFKPSSVHSRLREYSDLPLFGRPNELPNKEEPLGPFICDPNIKLDKDEINLLNKDPKYSLMQKTENAEFNTEVDRSLCKHRYGRGEKEKSKRKEKMGTGANKTVDDNSSVDAWNSVKHRYIYDPFKKSINFNYRRPTDYKNNKRIKLPKPLNSTQEFLCEVRRRKFISTFEKYMSVPENKAKKIQGKKT